MSIPTSQMLGEKQLSLYLSERGVDPRSIPAEALREIVEAASETADLMELRNSQAMVMYMGRLKTYSEVIADYCKKPELDREAIDPVVSDILKAYRVKSAGTY